MGCALRWATLKPQLQAELVAGTYRLSAVQRIHGYEDGHATSRELWSALDALVLKALAIVLTRYFEPQLAASCYHLSGHGGAKAAVRAVAAQLEQHTFVFRSDVKSYYASIEHDVLFSLLQAFIADARLLALLWSVIHRTVDDGGNYHDILRGIGLGCPVSSLLGAIYLKQMDEQMAEMAEKDVFYARFMDDWVILAPTRWKLRAAIKRVNASLAALGLEKHPDKTSIGRIAHGFTFLGYTFSPAGLGIAPQTIGRCVERIAQLYEHGTDALRIGEYARHWWRWVRAGVTLRAEELAGWEQGLQICWRR